MKPVTIINHLAIKPGSMDDFIDAQHRFVTALPSCGLIGGRMYRGVDGQTAVLVSTFESKEAQEGLLQRTDFKEHIQNLKAFVESSSPVFYDEAYTTGNF